MISLNHNDSTFLLAKRLKVLLHTFLFELNNEEWRDKMQVSINRFLSAHLTDGNIKAWAYTPFLPFQPHFSICGQRTTRPGYYMEVYVISHWSRPSLFIVYIENDTGHFGVKVNVHPSREDLTNSAKFSESSVFGQEGYLDFIKAQREGYLK